MNFEQPIPQQELPQEVVIDLSPEAKEFLPETDELIDLNDPFPQAPEEKEPVVL